MPEADFESEPPLVSALRSPEPDLPWGLVRFFCLGLVRTASDPDLGLVRTASLESGLVRTASLESGLVRTGEASLAGLVRTGLDSLAAGAFEAERSEGALDAGAFEAGAGAGEAAFEGLELGLLLAVPLLA